MEFVDVEAPNEKLVERAVVVPLLLKVEGVLVTKVNPPFSLLISPFIEVAMVVGKECLVPPLSVD